MYPVIVVVVFTVVVVVGPCVDDSDEGAEVGTTGLTQVSQPLF